MDSVERGNRDGLSGEKDSWAYGTDENYTKAYDHAEGVNARQEYDSKHAHDDILETVVNAIVGPMIGFDKSQDFFGGFEGRPLHIESQENDRETRETIESSSSSSSDSSDYGGGGGVGWIGWDGWFITIIFLTLIVGSLLSIFETNSSETFKEIGSFLRDVGANVEAVFKGEPHGFTVAIIRLTDGSVYVSSGSTIEVPFTDFGFLVKFSSDIEIRKEGNTFQIYNYYKDHEWTNVQILVFAQKGNYWRDSENFFFPEDNPANMLPITIDVLNLNGKQILLVSSIQGHFPQDSQVVLILNFSRQYVDYGGYSPRVFTISPTRQPEDWW